jgi:hypothetical protein
MQTAVAAPAYVTFNRGERQAVRWVEATTGPIVVDSTFTTSVTHTVHDSRPVLLAIDQSAATAIARRLASRGVTRFTLVSREAQQVLVFPFYRLTGVRRTTVTVVQEWTR